MTNEYKNINVVENKIILIVSTIGNLLDEHPDRVHDLNAIFILCKQYAIDLNIMKNSLDQGKGLTNESFFKEFIVCINDSLNEIQELLENDFNIILS